MGSTHLLKEKVSLGKYSLLKLTSVERESATDLFP